MMASVASDALGALVAVGVFQGGVDFGHGELTSNGSTDLFVTTGISFRF